MKPPDDRPPLSDVEWLRLCDVPAYVRRAYGFVRSRQTVYNWATRGVRRRLGQIVVLRTEPRAHVLHTKRQWVREFLEATDAGRWDQSRR